MSEENNYLVCKDSLSNLTVHSPLKKGKYFISKVRNGKSNVVVQFPRMTISKGWDRSQENFELEWSKMSGYGNDVYDWCQELNHKIIQSVYEGSSSWFGKEIPQEHIEEMYRNFIRTPKKSGGNMWMKVVPYVKDDNLLTTFFNSRGRELDCSEFKTGNFCVPILKLKYLIFTKDTCQIIWEIHSSKIYRPKKPVLKYSFKDEGNLDDADDCDDDTLLETESLAPQEEFCTTEEEEEGGGEEAPREVDEEDPVIVGENGD